MKEKFNIALKNQYKERCKIDVVAIVGDVIVFVADSKVIVASIVKAIKVNNKEPIKVAGENQDIINYLNYIANGEKQGWNLVESESDEYILVDGELYYLSYETTVPIGANERQIPSDTTIGDDISLCI